MALEPGGSQAPSSRQLLKCFYKQITPWVQHRCLLSPTKSVRAIMGPSESGFCLGQTGLCTHSHRPMAVLRAEVLSSGEHPLGPVRRVPKAAPALSAGPCSLHCCYACSPAVQNPQSFVNAACSTADCVEVNTPEHQALHRPRLRTDTHHMLLQVHLRHTPLTQNT